ncbi:MAG: hypothetical protein ABJB78_00975, partial [Betaproteobacteria bacterium]
PLMRVLDADRDGVLSDAELARAPEALRTLDANHDGQLSVDEFRPRPPFAKEKWLHRLAWFEQAGDRWWPIGGGVYYLRATKKVLGMRVIMPARELRERREEALAPAGSGRVRESLTTNRSGIR